MSIARVAVLIVGLWSCTVVANPRNVTQRRGLDPALRSHRLEVPPAGREDILKKLRFQARRRVEATGWGTTWIIGNVPNNMTSNALLSHFYKKGWRVTSRGELRRGPVAGKRAIIVSSQGATDPPGIPRAPGLRSLPVNGTFVTIRPAPPAVSALGSALSASPGRSDPSRPTG
eukprot:Hpha_TRINITY_DN14953_c0_g1::TRINITY_DN14953_c0_g1_i3::g.143882::m.143882